MNIRHHIHPPSQIYRAKWIILLLFFLMTCPLVDRSFAAGVTVIVHGHTGSFPSWSRHMGAEILGQLPHINGSASLKLYRLCVNNDLSVTECESIGPIPTESKNAEIVLLIDWSKKVLKSDDDALEKPLSTQEQTSTIAEALIPVLTTPGYLEDLDGIALAESPIHLIGHSRGGSLVADLARQLQKRGVWVEHMTVLDGVSLNPPWPLLPDPQINVYNNVIFADNYYQTSDPQIQGTVLPGAAFRLLPSLQGGYSNFGYSNHSNVHLWYFGTINTKSGADNGDHIITDQMRDDWYIQGDNDGSTAGYYFSRIAAHRWPARTDIRPNDGLHPSMGGTGIRVTASPDSPPFWPNVLIDNINNGRTNFTVGEDVRFTYYYQDRDNAPIVSLLLDNDTNPYNSPVRDRFYGGAHNSSSQINSRAITWQPTGSDVGTWFVLAKVEDGQRTRYYYIPKQITISPVASTPTPTPTPEPSNKYTFADATFCRDVQSNHPWEPITRISSYNMLEDVRLQVWWRLNDVYANLDYSPLIQVKAELYRPEGAFHDSVTWTIDAPDDGDWWSWYKGSQDLGYMALHNYPGTWECIISVKPEGSWIKQTELNLNVVKVTPAKAIGPSPSNGATGQSIHTDVSWSNGGGATSYDVYFGTDSTPDSGESKGNQSGTSYDPGTLAYSTTYYWRIDAKNSAGTTTGDVWSFTTGSAPPQPPNKATTPNPSNIATAQSINTNLSWINGGGATSYDVYFGTDSTPDSSEFKGNQSGTTYDPGPLAYSTTYYWRIDAKNSAGTTTGDVWRFTTQTAPSDKTIISIDADGDLSNGVQSTSDRGVGTHTISVVLTSFAAQSQSLAGYTVSIDISNPAILGNPVTFEDVTGMRLNIATDTDASDGRVRLGRAGTVDIPVSLPFELCRFTFTVKSPGSCVLDIGSPWPTVTQIGNLSQFTIPIHSVEGAFIGSGPYLPIRVGNPSPSDGAMGRSISTDIGWAKGSGATSYDVYFGTDSTPDSSEFRRNQTGTSYDPGTLAFNTTYYWQVDSRNPAGTTTGNVWSFTTEQGAPTWTISGYVRTRTGASIQGVTMWAGNHPPTSTNASGFYSIPVPNGWSGTITPGLSEHVFNPERQQYSNVTQNQANQNFTGAYLPAPTWLTASDGTSTSNICVTWADVADEAGYAVFRTRGGPYTEIAQTSANVTTYCDPYPCNTSGVYYKVKALFADGVSGFSPYDVGSTGDCGANRAPQPPICVSPVGNSPSLEPQLQASAFSDPDVGDTHQASEWRILNAGGLIWEHLDTDTDKTSQKVPAGVLSPAAPYWWRVRYQDSKGIWSAWPNWCMFTTSGRPPEQPVARAPICGENNVQAPVTLLAAMFADLDPGSWQKASHWKVVSVTGVVWETIDTVSASKIIIQIPPGVLKPSTPYWWMVRYQDNDGMWSPWSDWCIFKTRGRRPAQPSGISPECGDQSTTLPAILIASEFADPDDGDWHRSSEWRIVSATGPVWENAEPGNVSKRWIPVPAGVLRPAAAYWWTVRYEDNNNMWSDWSPWCMFRTVGKAPHPPYAVNPMPGAKDVALPVSLRGSSFVDDDPEDFIGGSSWSVVSATGLVFAATDESSFDMTTITIPDGRIASGSPYWWRVRYRDNYGLWSLWSEWSMFSTAVANPSDLNADGRIDYLDLFILAAEREAPVNASGKPGVEQWNDMHNLMDMWHENSE